MPKTKFQKFIFGLLMTYTMTCGMELYNLAILTGGFSGLSRAMVGEKLIEMLYMGVFVFLFSNLWGNRIGAVCAAKAAGLTNGNPRLCQLARQIGTIVVMCPTMSLVASILFNIIQAGIPAAQLPDVWTATFLRNLPMAFVWNIFAAAPFSRWAFGRMFPMPAASVSKSSDIPLHEHEFE